MPCGSGTGVGKNEKKQWSAKPTRSRRAFRLGNLVNDFHQKN
jgi:hypothetical protein